jgi:hypothetical protein
MTARLAWAVCLIALLQIAGIGDVYGVVYVDDNPPGSGNNGTSWTDAYTNLQVALAATAAGDIWVAEGTYVPTGTARSASFQMKSSVNLYGGFTNGSSWAERNWSNYFSILNGDIGTPGDSSDNCYHVIRGANNAILDGLVVAKGNANGSNPDYFGGGMYNGGVSPTVRNCTFTSNDCLWGGGGMAIVSASPLVDTCTFITNGGVGYAPGIYIGGATSTGVVTNCTFICNALASVAGAAYVGDSAAPRFESCLFATNSSNNGNAMEVNGASAWIRNCVFRGNWYAGSGVLYFNNCTVPSTVDSCTFVTNSSYSQGVIYNVHSSPIITNCTFARNGYLSGSSKCGAIYNLYSDSSPTITDCRFIDNVAYESGVIYTYGGSPIIRNCVFAGNCCAVDSLIRNDVGASVRIQNCVFVGNQGLWAPGATIWNMGASTASVINCTFSGNNSTYGGAIGSTASSRCFVTNCILWGNPSGTYGAEIYNINSATIIGYTDIKGGWNGAGIYNAGGGSATDGGGNLDTDPLFGVAVTGAWSAAGVYDPDNGRTLLADSSATWTPGALVGAFVNPKTNSTERFQYLVITNTATSITVWGDASTLATSGAKYRINDFHEKSVGGRWTVLGWVNDESHSPCIDKGDPASAFDAEPRPNGRLVNMGAYGNTAQASKSSGAMGTTVMLR